jgi:hypothetical protein
VQSAPVPGPARGSKKRRTAIVAGALALLAAGAAFTLPVASATQAHMLGACTIQTPGGLEFPGQPSGFSCGGWTLQFGSPWNSIVTVSWSSAPQSLANSNPASMPCTLPGGQLIDEEGNSASFTFTSSGGSTDCTFFDVMPEPVWVNVTIVSPAL